MLFLTSLVAFSLVGAAAVPALVSRVPFRSSRRGTRKGRVDESNGTPPRCLMAEVDRTLSGLRQTKDQYRLLEVASLVRESDEVVSVSLRGVDGQSLPAFRPGQHLIIERPPNGNAPLAHRCYTLSNDPTAACWRITVRKSANGQARHSVSHWIHDELRVGDRLRVRGPRGHFTLDLADSTKDVVFIAAGVGITPMASMLHAELASPTPRRCWLFYQVRTMTNAPLIDELVPLIECSKTCQATIAASKLEIAPKFRSRRVKIREGKFEPAAFASLIGSTDINVFLCGPPQWMDDTRDGLVASGVPDEQIHHEMFGEPETTSAGSPTSNVPLGASTSSPTFQVAYEVSGKEAAFVGSQSSLLAHAKTLSVEIPASCRAGHCGTCAVRLLRGTVAYRTSPKAELAPNEILPCICAPTSDIALQA